VSATLTCDLLDLICEQVNLSKARFSALFFGGVLEVILRNPTSLNRTNLGNLHDIHLTPFSVTINLDMYNK